jgi:hypothetical protein
MATECFNCQQPVTETAKFCGPCGINIRCTDKECGHDLYAGEAYCRECGKEVVVRKQSNSVGQNTSGVPINTIRFRQDRTTTELDINVTDVVGVNSMDMVAAVLNGNASRLLNGGRRKPIDITPPLGQGSLFNEANEDRERETPESPKLQAHNEPGSDVAPAQESPQSPPTVTGNTPAKQPANEEEHQLSSLFISTDEGWSLEYIDLKAHSKADFFKRLIILFVYCKKSIHSQGLVSREEVKKLLQYYDLYDGNLRKWYSSSADRWLHVTDKDLRIKGTGEIEAKKYLSDVFDGEKKGKWQLDSPKKRRRSGAKKGAEETDSPESEE